MLPPQVIEKAIVHRLLATLIRAAEDAKVEVSSISLPRPQRGNSSAEPVRHRLRLRRMPGGQSENGGHNFNPKRQLNRVQ